MFTLLMLTIIFSFPFARSLHQDELISIISRSCTHKGQSCPKLEFGRFTDDKVWEIDVGRIKESRSFKALLLLTEDSPVLKSTVQATFCCLDGNCLERCGIAMANEEIDLIKDFPNNWHQLKQLPFAPIQKHKEHVTHWLEELEAGRESPDHVPSEIDDFYDTLHKYRHEIWEKIRENNLKKFISEISLFATLVLPF